MFVFVEPYWKNLERSPEGVINLHSEQVCMDLDSLSSVKKPYIYDNVKIRFN